MTIENYYVSLDAVLKWTEYIGTMLITLAIVGGVIYLWLLWNKKRLTK